MKTHPRFGDFLLFQKLSASPLGSVFRAGRLQARAIDRVALLLRFDGGEIDRERLAADLERGEKTLEALEAPRFAHGLTQGAVDGIPYVAYDYLIGRSLGETLSRLRELGDSPEPSYLLALVEQVSAALTAAAKIQIRGLPIRHGFLIPELLLLSAEGRIHPLAFSCAPALARQKALRELYAHYLAPELLAEAGGRPSEDVYSLAAILFDGLTGAPPDPAGSTSAQVDRALLAHRGVPLPPTVQNLLKDGLAAADSRPDLPAFHRRLQAALEECDSPPSQFQLAFFLHRLFRDELEGEAVAMRAEKNVRFDPAALSSTREPAASRAAPDEAPLAEAPVPDPLVQSQPSAPAGRGPVFRPFLAGLALSLTAALAVDGVAGWLGGAPSGDQSPRPALSSATGRDGSSDLKGEVRRLVKERGARLRAELENEYEPRLTALRRELAEARRASSSRSPSAPRRSPEPIADPAPAGEAGQRSSVDGAEGGPPSGEPSTAPSTQARDRPPRNPVRNGG